MVLNLPTNGLRLRFDGPQQRLRLIEVLDFTKSQLTYKDKEVLRAPTAAQTASTQPESVSGPTFRHIYNRLLGPTFPGEYIQPEAGDETLQFFSPLISSVCLANISGKLLYLLG